MHKKQLFQLVRDYFLTRQYNKSRGKSERKTKQYHACNSYFFLDSVVLLQSNFHVNSEMLALSYGK